MADPWMFDNPGSVPGIAGGMINPSDYGGLLADPEELKRLIAQIAPLMQQFQPNEADQRNANTQAIITAGLSMLGTRKGQEWDRLGYAGMNAMDAKGASLAGSQAAKKAQMGDALQAMNLLGQVQKQKQAAALQAQLGGVFADGGASGAAPGPLPESGAGSPAPTAPTSSRAAQYRKAAAIVAPSNPAQAKIYMEMADKEDEEFSLTPQVVMVDGKPTLVRYGKRGGSRTEAGAPEPSIHWGSTGGITNIPIDQRTQLPLGPGMPATMDPAQEESARVARAHLGLSQAANSRAAAAAGREAGPQLVNGQFVYKPDAANPTGRAVTPAGLQAPEKDLNETQAKATAYVNQMENANQVLAGLQKKGFTGKGKMQQADIAGAGAEGIPYVPGTAAIPRWIASDNAQKYSNAELQWTEPVLRFLTGANAPKEEVIRNAATFFPRPGDSDAVIEQKAEARANMEQSIRLAAGRGAAKVPQRQDANSGRSAAGSIRAQADAILQGR